MRAVFQKQWYERAVFKKSGMRDPFFKIERDIRNKEGCNDLVIRTRDRQGQRRIYRDKEGRNDLVMTGGTDNDKEGHTGTNNDKEGCNDLAMTEGEGHGGTYRDKEGCNDLVITE
tara:strand:- start:959 stop:1303 length:345 start_codon:yes stop_codon:yes gene_type:complete